MLKYIVASGVVLASVCAAVAGVAATSGGGRLQIAAAAAQSCSGWRSICEAQGPGCGVKFEKCLKTGCWTEAPQYGGQQHCGLTRK